MPLNSSPTEVVTAATNLPLAFTALLAVARLWQRRRPEPLRAGVWIGMFGNLAMASALGVVAHGLAFSDEARDLLWRPLNAALAVTVAFFVAGAVLDCWGRQAARSTLPWLLLLSAGFWCYATFLSSSFLSFVLYEGAAMLLSLGVYLALAAQGRPGAGWMVAGVTVTILAAALQATRLVTFAPALPLDHNGVFHLVQVPGLLCLLAGLQKTLGEPARAASNEPRWLPAPQPRT